MAGFYPFCRTSSFHGEADAILLLQEHVVKESLMAHCRATAAIMRATAGALDEDADLWEVIGILHDIDYEEVDGGYAVPW